MLHCLLWQRHGLQARPLRLLHAGLRCLRQRIVVMVVVVVVLLLQLLAPCTCRCRPLCCQLAVLQ